VLAVSSPQVDLVSWREVGAHLQGTPDDELIRDLRRRGYDGLITCDYHMLDNPGVLKAMHDTGMSVIACKDVGHDPIRATGLLLYNLEHIANNFQRERAQPWLLKSQQSSPREFNKHVRELEARLGYTLGI